MKALSIILLALVCIVVSASMNVKFFYQFALSAGTSTVLFVALALLFDFAKITASTQITSHIRTAPLLSFGWVIVWLLGVSVSMFASISVIDSSAQTIKSDGSLVSVYQSKADNLQRQVDELNAELKTASAKRKRKINSDLPYLTNKLSNAQEQLANELKNPSATTASKNTFLIDNSRYLGLGISIFVEVISLMSGLTFGLNNASENAHKTVQNTSKKQVLTNAHENTREPLITGASGAHNNVQKSVNKMNVNVLKALLKQNGDHELSYRKIALKYDVKNNEIIKQAKQMIVDESKPVQQIKQDEVKLSDNVISLVKI